MQKEAIAFTKYLVGELPQKEIIERYINAISLHGDKLSDKETKRLNAITRFPLLIPMVDSALALKDPNNLIRKRIFIMLSILEASTIYTKHFLPQERSFFYMLTIFFAGVRAVIYFVIGTIILMFI